MGKVWESLGKVDQMLLTAAASKADLALASKRKIVLTLLVVHLIYWVRYSLERYTLIYVWERFGKAWAR